MTHLVINAFRDSWLNVAHKAIANKRDEVVGDVHEHVSGVAGFAKAILKRPVGDITQLTVNSHGAPGIAMRAAADNDQPLDRHSLLKLASSGPLANRFAAGAQIVFKGCNVAGKAKHAGATSAVGDLAAGLLGSYELGDVITNAQAEVFLSNLGRVLLLANGGTITGYTGYGFDLGVMVHPDGEEVTARVEPGGRATFDAAVELSADLLRQRIPIVRGWTPTGIVIQKFMRGEQLTDTVDSNALLDEAERWVGHSGTPTCQDAFKGFMCYIRAAHSLYMTG